MKRGKKRKMSKFIKEIGVAVLLMLIVSVLIWVTNKNSSDDNKTEQILSKSSSSDNGTTEQILSKSSASDDNIATEKSSSESSSSIYTTYSSKDDDEIRNSYSNVDKEQLNANARADYYGNRMGMGHDDIIEQLVSDGFTQEQAKKSADSGSIDYNAGALKKAHYYQDRLHMSKQEIIEQLVSDTFTQEQAQQAVNNL